MHSYFTEYAEPEAMRIAGAFSRSERFGPAVVIPACGESELLEGCLDSLDKAARSSNFRALAIVVVNAREDHPSHVHLDNRATLSALRSRSGLEICTVDCASAGRRFPPKQGVGLARKMGADVAVALHAAGVVTSPVIHTTDADARVDNDYFEPSAQEGAAFLHPFTHVLDRPSDPLGLYEISLRYYVLGLRYAGSPYAFHTIGSTIGFHAAAYLAVRGFPRREAAEDFYFLSKLAKVGNVVKHRGRVHLLSRESARVPFGTGAGTRKIRESLGRGETFTLYHPEIFNRLKARLELLEEFVQRRDPGRLSGDIAPALVKLAANHPREADLRRAVRGWFDAFRTLKLVHHWRDTDLPNVEYHRAIAQAPFTGNRMEKDPDSDALNILHRVRELDSPHLATQTHHAYN